jgi:hypothetical protein
MSKIYSGKNCHEQARERRPCHNSGSPRPLSRCVPLHNLRRRRRYPILECTSRWGGCGAPSNPAMHRLTARLLLVFMLVGTFAPAALAISTPPPHACCMRKPMHDQAVPQAEFQAIDCCSHNCCRPLTVSHRAQPRPPISARSIKTSATLLFDLHPVHRTTELNPSHSVRAPPVV